MSIGKTKVHRTHGICSKWNASAEIVRQAKEHVRWWLKKNSKYNQKQLPLF